MKLLPALWVFAIVAMSAQVPAGRAAIHIAPTTVAIEHGETSASFLVRNDSPATVTFAIRSHAWRNVGDGDIHLESTDDVVVFPTRIVVTAGETRRVRVATRVPAARSERAYRVILEQTDAAVPSGGGVAMRLTFSLPLFVQPRDRRATVDLSTPQVDGQALRLRLSNTSGMHVTPRQIAVTGRDPAGAVVWTRTFRPWYLLAHETRELTAALSPSDCAKTSVVAAEVRFLEGEALTLRRTLPLTRQACGSP